MREGRERGFTEVSGERERGEKREWREREVK